MKPSPAYTPQPKGNSSFYGFHLQKSGSSAESSVNEPLPPHQLFGPAAAFSNANLICDHQDTLLAPVAAFSNENHLCRDQEQHQVIYEPFREQVPGVVSDDDLLWALGYPRRVPQDEIPQDVIWYNNNNNEPYHHHELSIGMAATAAGPRALPQRRIAPDEQRGSREDEVLPAYNFQQACRQNSHSLQERQQQLRGDHRADAAVPDFDIFSALETAGFLDI